MPHHASPDSPGDLDHALSAALQTVLPRYIRALRRAVESVEGEDSLTLPQFYCLEAIGVRGAALTTQLARQMQVAVPTMTSRLDGLVERGLVERQPDPLSRRQVRVVMTVAGDALLRRYRASVDARLRVVLGPLSGESRAQLLAALADLAEALPEAAVECAPVGSAISV